MRNLNKKKIALLTACVVSAVGHMAFAAEADNYDEYSGADYVVTATKTQLEKKRFRKALRLLLSRRLKNWVPTAYRMPCVLQLTLMCKRLA